MPDLDKEKRNAAARAVEMVREGMRVGLGTGSTAAHVVRLLAERVRQGLRVTGIPTSARTRRLAEELGVPLTTLEEDPSIDITIDGADEADRRLRLIKGGGGALLREKIVASASRQLVIVADSSKLVESIGAYPLPVEVVPFAAALAEVRLRQLGAQPVLRHDNDGDPFLTDEMNYIFDARFARFPDPEELARKLDSMPGIVDHGLFLGLAHTLVIGRGDDTELYERW